MYQLFKEILQALYLYLFCFLDVQKMKEHEIVLALKVINHLQKENTIMKISKILQDKLTVKNVVAFYSLAKCYNIETISKSSLLFIERCFPMVVETQNFLHLDFSNLAKILASSELNIHSEVEIFDAAITWLKHNIEERSKYAKQLLLKVRFTLLSEHALQYLSNSNFMVTKNTDTIKTIKEILPNQKTYYSARTDKYNTGRYCSQNYFNFFVFGGRNEQNLVVRNVHQIDGSTLKHVKDISSMTIERRESRAVCVKGEVYFFGGFEIFRTDIMFIEKYSPLTNTWNKVANIFDKRLFFCACVFVDKIFIVGGYCYNDNFNRVKPKYSLQFNLKDNSWKEICEMNEERANAACVVFQGNIVVSGGYDNDDNDLNTVESYDVFGDKWLPMPKTINNHSYHNLVVVKEKLFVVGEEPNFFEVFDNVCKKFVSLKQPPCINFNKSVAIGNKIVVFQENRSTKLCYDVDKDEWSEESCEVTKDLSNFSCVKLPWY